jgi:pimeloyl-ACP methyl ester carboxylesterase
MTRTAADTVTDVGSGPPVLLVHGQPGSRVDWRALIPLLATDHRVIAVDRPGYGTSTEESLGLEQNAFRLGLLLAERGAVGATVVGHSLGAGIALAMAERSLGVGGLVLAGAAGVAGTVGPLDHVLALPLVGAVGVQGVRLITRTVWRDRSRPVVAAIEGWGPRSGRSFAREQRALLRELTVLESELDAIDVPSTVVVGGRDRVVRPAVQRAIAGRIPGARMVELESAGHLIPITHAAELAAIVRAAVAAQENGCT